MAIEPETERLKSVTKQFADVAEAAHKAGAETALIVGPNKSSVYADKLPTGLVPAQTRYISSFISELNAVPHLLTIEPTSLLVEQRDTEGLLYWRTDTHWNHKGAFLAFESMLNQLGYVVPEVSFELKGSYHGDLIGLSGLEDFPITPGDHWKFEVPNLTDAVKEPHPDGEKRGWRGIVRNSGAVNDRVAWVVGDSFRNAMRSFIEASFTEVHYIGYWGHELNNLPKLIESSNQKPDLVMIVRVERSF